MEGYRIIMKVPETPAQHSYITAIRKLESQLKHATGQEGSSGNLENIQQQLDELAEQYQYDESIGTARFKMYELQALIHYFNGDDEGALTHIAQAEDTRGETYPRAETLKRQILAQTHPGKNPTKHKLSGLEGWLAIFIVGIGISSLINIVSLLGYPSTFSDISSMQDSNPAFVAAMLPALWFEVLQFMLVIGLAIYLIVLLAQHKRLAKRVAIILLVIAPVLGVIDYVWASSIFDSFNLNLDSELSKQSGNIGRGIIAALVWIPYFLVSKRIKATLTR
jgi:hypothetical protein